MRRLVIGDIHGGYRSMMQCFERAKFDKENDKLICVGDIVDGWPETMKCVDELLTVKNFVFVVGNHDKWAYDWAKHGEGDNMLWLKQGGENTIKSYDSVNRDMPEEHIKFFERSVLWHEEDDILFVHGGIDPWEPMEKQVAFNVMWDRNILQLAWIKRHKTGHRILENTVNEKYKAVFIGHTTTYQYTEDGLPITACEVTDLDTGGGWEGKLTIMDLDTREFWQSDFVDKLYPEERGRR
jgi:serine/threonine protein phosphatase 1